MMNLSKFLITTSKSVYLYDNGLKEIHTGNGVYFGVTRCGLDRYIVLARNNQDGTDGGHIAGINSLIFFDENFKKINEVQLDIIKDGHQICCDFKGDLYICNSGLNLITRIQQNGKADNLCLNGMYGEDINHYNSLSFKNDYWYICRHRSEHGKDDGGILIFNKDWNFLTSVEVGKHAHNAIEKDGFVWSTLSSEGKLVRIERANLLNRKVYNIAPGFLTRGLVITDEYLLCGVSEFGVRSERHKEKDAYIYTFKYPEIEYINKITLNGCGQLNDILLT